MLAYEICYITREAKIALVYRAQMFDDRDAVRAASEPIPLRYKHFEVWRGRVCRPGHQSAATELKHRRQA